MERARSVASSVRHRAVAHVSFGIGDDTPTDGNASARIFSARVSPAEHNQDIGTSRCVGHVMVPRLRVGRGSRSSIPTFASPDHGLRHSAERRMMCFLDDRHLLADFRTPGRRAHHQAVRDFTILLGFDRLRLSHSRSEGRFRSCARDGAVRRGVRKRRARPRRGGISTPPLTCGYIPTTQPWDNPGCLLFRRNARVICVLLVIEGTLRT